MPTGDRDDPLNGFNFIINFEGLRAGFSEVTGITGGDTGVIDYRLGDETEGTIRKLPGLTKYEPIVLKRGVTPNYNDVVQWRQSVIEGRTERRSGTITLRNEAHEAAIVIQIDSAWPSKLTGPVLNATENKVAIEELTLQVEKVVREI